MTEAHMNLFAMKYSNR